MQLVMSSQHRYIIVCDIVSDRLCGIRLVLEKMVSVYDFLEVETVF